MAARYTTDQVIEAIRESHGILTAAAKKLGCTRQTVHDYVKRFPTVREAYEEESESLVDFAEMKLFEQIGAGNIAAIIFALKAKGKARGWVESYSVKAEVTGPKDGAIPVALVDYRVGIAEA